MANITLKGNTIHTQGELPAVNSQAPDFTLVATNLSEKKMADYAGKKVVMNIFPSVDTGVCAASVRHFNKDAAALENTVVLCISKDLPFAQNRFCGAEGIQNVEMLSAFRSEDFKNYQLEILDGGMKGLLSRSVIVLDETGKVVYSEQVPEIAQEPDYEKALAALK